MYLGTEPGEVYKSSDAGNNWITVCMTIDFESGVCAIEVHPSNEDIVFAVGNNGIFKSIDGGASWINAKSETEIRNVKILVN